MKFQLHGGRWQKEVSVACTKESLIYKDTLLKIMRSKQDETTTTTTLERIQLIVQIILFRLLVIANLLTLKLRL